MYSPGTLRKMTAEREKDENTKALQYVMKDHDRYERIMSVYDAIKHTNIIPCVQYDEKMSDTMCHLRTAFLLYDRDVAKRKTYDWPNHHLYTLWHHFDHFRYQDDDTCMKYARAMRLSK